MGLKQLELEEQSFLHQPSSSGSSNANAGPQEFQYHELTFTKDTKDKLGEGTFGCVYKGWINNKSKGEQDNIVVAIKCSKGFRRNLERLNYEREKKYLGNLNHENIIKLHGYCEHMSDKFTKRSFEDKIADKVLKRGPTKVLHLVYEFMPNGTVSEKLRDLDWTQTKKIARGLAAALKYLQAQNPPLVFRDIKPENILLDENFNAKLSNFGLVREENEILVAGTVGYTDPATLDSGDGRKEADIFSFGVVLMQLISKASPIFDKSRKHIIERIYESWCSGHMLIGRKLLETGCEGSSAQIITRLALCCVNPDFASRPRIDDIIQELNKLV